MLWSGVKASACFTLIAPSEKTAAPKKDTLKARDRSLKGPEEEEHKRNKGTLKGDCWSSSIWLRIIMCVFPLLGLKEIATGHIFSRGLEQMKVSDGEMGLGWTQVPNMEKQIYEKQHQAVRIPSTPGTPGILRPGGSLVFPQNKAVQAVSLVSLNKNGFPSNNNRTVQLFTFCPPPPNKKKEKQTNNKERLGVQVHLLVPPTNGRGSKLNMRGYAGSHFGTGFLSHSQIPTIGVHGLSKKPRGSRLDLGLACRGPCEQALYPSERGSGLGGLGVSG